MKRYRLYLFAFMLIWLFINEQFIISCALATNNYYVTPCSDYQTSGPCGTSPYDSIENAGDFKSVFEKAYADNQDTVIIFLEGLHEINLYGELQYNWNKYRDISLRAEDEKTAEDVILDGGNAIGQNFLKFSQYNNRKNLLVENLTIQNFQQVLRFGHQLNTTIQNCIIQDNGGENTGNVIQNTGGSSCNQILFYNNTFRRNISCNNGGAIRVWGNGEQFLTLIDNKFDSNFSFIDGGAVANGLNANFIGNSYGNNRAGIGESSGSGGAIRIFGGALSIDNDTFTENEAWEKGGAIICNTADDSVIIQNCIFTSNKITEGSTHNNQQGGAIIFDHINGNSSVTDCTFTSCQAATGGAIKFSNGAEGNVSRCKFINNVATATGAGALEFGGNRGVPENAQTSTLSHCLFDSNEASGEHGSGYGGAWKSINRHSVTAFNNTYYNNKAVKGNGVWARSVIGDNSSTIFLKNEIYFNGGTDEIYANIPATLIVEYCNIQGGEAACTNTDIYSNNILIDPEFVEPEYGDFHLQITSTCIDAGDNNIYEGIADIVDIEGNEITDQDGNITAIGGIVDIGAYECLLCYGDFDDDHDVDGSDLAYFASDNVIITNIKLFAGSFGRIDCPMELQFH